MDIKEILEEEGVEGKGYLEDDYLDLIDERLGIDFLCDINAIEDIDHINYQNIINYMINGGDLITIEAQGQTIYVIPEYLEEKGVKTIPEKLMFSIEHQDNFSEMDLEADNWEEAIEELANYFGYNLIVRPK